ncbi:T9SS C-terminal target domain-containing protein [uncultured Eudoraea sp.]|uniref:T9SS C-terminal target domain-containing protein n=1 Tax=uncultured Eudoraea sp. TaxID=1035614 RepID=UPI002614A941|nr:T9SS C-terminal target domain-containing protein [uncultured Eudoraea sp.]
MMISKLYILSFFLPVFFLNAQVSATTIGTLPEDVLESSGLIYYNNKLITHNDSGNSPRLYEVDTLSSQIIRTITIDNATNIDWEDITQDDTYIYIGDFGNNTGNRQDLTVYRVAKSDYDVSNTISAERIDFSYEDQTDFTEIQNSDWDAEGMVDFKTQLLIFTKQWQTNGTVAYSIPKIPGSYSAKNMGFYDVSGLVTGAAYNKFSNVLMLLGYSSQLQPFIVRISELPINFSFNGTEEKLGLGIGFSQVEGITYSDSNTYYVSSERYQNNLPPITLASQLYTFDTDDAPQETAETPADAEKEENELIIFRAFGSNELQYDLNSNAPLFGRAIFDITGKRVRHTHGSLIENNSIDLSGLGSSVYYLTFYLQGVTISKPFILD